MALRRTRRSRIRPARSLGLLLNVRLSADRRGFDLELKHFIRDTLVQLIE